MNEARRVPTRRCAWVSGSRFRERDTDRPPELSVAVKAVSSKETQTPPPPVMRAEAPRAGRKRLPGRIGEPRQPQQDPERAAAAHRAGGVVLRTLTDEERDARAHALAEARVREAEERQSAESEARRRQDEDVRLARERTEAERRHTEEEARKQSDDQARRRAEDEARRRLGEEAAPVARTDGASPGTTTTLLRPGLRLAPKRLEATKPTRTKAAPGGDRRVAHEQ